MKKGAKKRKMKGKWVGGKRRRKKEGKRGGGGGKWKGEEEKEIKLERLVFF